MAVWATLEPLAENYGIGTNDVYAHIQNALGLDLGGVLERDHFKSLYRDACHAIGANVIGNNPSDLFFPLMGVADAQLRHFAAALARALRSFGPPATEDTPSAVQWQRRALHFLPDHFVRARTAVVFDRAGYYAQRVNAWRLEEEPRGPRDAALFSALEAETADIRLLRSCIVAPPEVCWHRDSLAFLPEEASVAQSLTVGAFPNRISNGVPFAVASPWPDNLLWTADRSERIACAPEDGQCLIFDAETGRLEVRTSLDVGQVSLRCKKAIVLARSSFFADGFGSSIEAVDPAFQLVWVDVDAGAKVHFGNEKTTVLCISREMEPSLRIDSPRLGGWGTRVLREGSSEGAVEVQLSPGMLAPRILRVRMNGRELYAPVQPDAEGRARVSFTAIRLDQVGNPGPAVFELLVTGASEGAEARAELKTTSHIWPGVARGDSGNIDFADVPSTFNTARSSGFVRVADQLRQDPHTERAHAVLAVDTESGLAEYDIPFLGVRLWRYRPGVEGRERVRRGGRLVRNHRGRHDVLVVEARGSSADLRVFGNLYRRAFMSRGVFEIGAEALEVSSLIDDRVLLEHTDGRSELLVRVFSINDPSEIVVAEEPDGSLILHVTPGSAIDALGVRIKSADGGEEEGAEPFGPNPVARRLPEGIVARQIELGVFEVAIDGGLTGLPARATLLARIPGRGLEVLTGGDGYPIALGIKGDVGTGSDPGVLSGLATLLAEPTTAALGDQLPAALTPAQQMLAQSLESHRMVRSIIPALAVEREGGAVARGDALSFVPWLFEKEFSAFHKLAGHPHLAALGNMSAVGAASDLPDPLCQDPCDAWLDRLANEIGLPDELTASALERGVATLRVRLFAKGAGALLETGALGRAAQLLLNVDSAPLDRLRAYDREGGIDSTAARIVALLERFARASRLGGADAFFDGLTKRTELSRGEIGEAVTVMVRSGAEIFAQTLVFWDQAVLQHEYKKDST